MDAYRCEPLGSWNAFDGRRPAHTRPDKGPTGCEIDNLSRAHAQHGMRASLVEAGEMSVRTQTPIDREHVTGL
jgi:hypothetical protein